MISFELMKHGFNTVLATLCLFSFGLSSCSDDPIPIGKLHWVEGEWKGRVKGGMMYEVWELGVDSAIVGHSWTMVQSDTIFQETMQIIKKNEDIFYVVKVAHNNAPVSFKLVEHTSKGYFFENLEHDFPTRIVYANTLGDMMLVRIEGKRDQKGDTTRFFMHRNVQFPPGDKEAI